MPLHMQSSRLQPLHGSSLSHKYIHVSTMKRRWPQRSPGHASSSRDSSTCGCKALTDSSPHLLRPLLIDNYDSYTYNLYQIISEVYGGKALAGVLHPSHQLCPVSSCPPGTAAAAAAGFSTVVAPLSHT
jgi:hypothetical protein